MKRKTIVAAACCLALGGAWAQSSVTVYGLLDTGVTYVNKVQGPAGTSPGSVWSVHPGAMQASRLGYRGAEDLGGGNRALFALESGLSVPTGAFSQGGIPFGRKSVVGLGGGWGTLLVGRQTDPLDDMGALDSNIDFGAQVAPIHGLDRTYADRTNNSFRYNSPRIAALSIMAMGGLGENANNFHAGQVLAFGADYTLPHLRLAAAYYQSRLGATSADAGFSRIGAAKGNPGDVALRTYTLGAAWQWGPARLHGTYSDVRQPLAVASAIRTLRGPSAARAQIFDLALSYQVLPALYANVSVIRDLVHFVGASGGHVTQYNAGLDYFLSKRTDLYFLVGQQGARHMDTPGMDPGAPGADRTQRLTRVGIRHKF